MGNEPGLVAEVWFRSCSPKSASTYEFVSLSSASTDLYFGLSPAEIMLNLCRFSRACME